MAGQPYGLSAHLRNTTYEVGPPIPQRRFRPQEYGLDFSSSVKCMALVDKAGNTPRRDLRYESPTKRQKVEDPTSEVKFVTQTKWKFPESQKWIEVQQTPSTQARNAARASREAENTALLQARQNEGRNSGHTRNVSGPQRLSFGDVEELKDARSASENTKSWFTNHSQPMSTFKNSSSGERPPRQDMNNPTISNNLGPFAQQVFPASFSTHLNNGIEFGPTFIAPKTISQADRALSLEKDADRIAALIAEKRKTNESTMFRQKMLQKQMEHQGERSSTIQDIGTMKGTSVEPANATSQDSFEEADRQRRADAYRTQSPEALPDEIHVRPITRRSGHSQKLREDTCLSSAAILGIRSAEFQHIQGQHTGETSSSHTQDRAHPIAHVAEEFSSSSRGQQIGTMSQQTMQNQSHRQQIVGRAKNPSIVSTPINATPVPEPNHQISSYNQKEIQLSSSDSSSADPTAQIVVAADQTSAPGGNLKERIGPATAMMASRMIGLAASSQKSLTQMRPTRRPNSGPVSQVSNPANLAQLGPSPPQFQYNMHFQSNLSSQRVEASPAEAYVAPPHWPSRFSQNQVPYTTQSSIIAPTLYNINQNFFLGNNQVIQPQQDHFATTANPLYTHPNPVEAPNLAVAAANSSMHPNVQSTYAMPQHMHVAPHSLPQPPVLGSNINMFSGQARACGNGQGLEPARRERANMFTSRNTAMGTSFGGDIIMAIQDVRRQIEMT